MGGCLCPSLGGIPPNGGYSMSRSAVLAQDHDLQVPVPNEGIPPILPNLPAYRVKAPPPGFPVPRPIGAPLHQFDAGGEPPPVKAPPTAYFYV